MQNTLFTNWYSFSIPSSNKLTIDKKNIMSNKLEIYLSEYNALKEEQKSRIGFRDNLLYVNLAAVGAIVSFSLTKPENKYALLVLPLVSIILGWTYLVNDQKISIIGQYIQEELLQKVRQVLGEPSTSLQDIFGWEYFHREKNPFAQGFRKFQQWLIDELTFVGSGILGLILFQNNMAAENSLIQTIWFIELILLILIGIEFSVYAIISWTR